MPECGCLEYEPGLVIEKCDACREKERLAQQPKPVDLEQVQKDLDHAHGSPGRFNLHQGCRWARAMIPELQAARDENERLRARSNYQTPEEALAQQQEIEDLKAIVAQLPKTADGVPVVPGMEVWDPVWPQRPMHIDRLEVVAHDTRRSEWVCNDGEIDPRQCYSTRKAADAAKGGE